MSVLVLDLSGAFVLVLVLVLNLSGVSVRGASVLILDHSGVSVSSDVSLLSRPLLLAELQWSLPLSVVTPVSLMTSTSLSPASNSRSPTAGKCRVSTLTKYLHIPGVVSKPPNVAGASSKTCAITGASVLTSCSR